MADDASGGDFVHQVALGLMFDHSMLSETTRQMVETATEASAVVELLVERGLIDPAELAARSERIRADLQHDLARRGLGLYLNQDDDDKYDLTDLPQINCAERVHLCKAACCTLRFPLSRQDVEEAVVRWDFGRPYWNLTDQTGYCVHCTPTRTACAIYEHRPSPCRRYDCREDERIWADFEGMVVSPGLDERLASARSIDGDGTAGSDAGTPGASGP
jgi:Fe-S-cluster containining protein